MGIFFTNNFFLLSLNFFTLIIATLICYRFYKKCKNDSSHESITNTKKFQDIVIRSIPDYVFVKDEQFRIVQANPAFMSLYPAHMQDKIIGYTTLEEYEEDEAQAFLAMDKKALRDGLSETEETIQFPDGQKRTLLTKKVRFKNDQGQLFILGVARDITEVKETQKKLIEAEHTNKVYADATNDGYWDWLVQENYQYMSPRFWEMFGYNPKEKTHTPTEWQDIIFPEDLKVALNNFQKHVETRGKHPYEQEVRYRHKNGSTVHVICKGEVVEWSKDGTPLRMIGTHTDITNLKNTQAELVSIRNMLENSLNEIYIFDAETLNFILTNKGAQSNIGYNTEELRRLTPLDIKPKMSHEDFKQTIAPLVQGKKEKIIFETVHERKDRSVYYVEVHLQMDIYLGRKVFVAIILDITERKKGEAELLRSNQDLDDFSYIASHDLKEPLRGIYNHAKLLYDDYHESIDEEGKHKLTRILYLAERMETLISNLLYYARLGRDTMAPVETDLNLVINEIRNMMSDTKGIHIQVKDKLPIVLGNKTHITELYRNLITNAIKYNNAEEKNIEIGFDENTNTEGKKQTVFYVKDNGIGIKERFHEDIFKIFKRLHKRDAYGGGTGAGLTFVKKIVDRHGGEVWLDSTPDEGSTFYFTLDGGPTR